MSTPAIIVEGLHKTYGETIALRNVSFQVEQGSILAVVGPDGAGKTTLIRSLAGILEGVQGDIQFPRSTATNPSSQRQTTLGYMPQRFGLYEDLTVQENIDFFADLFSVKGAERTSRIKRLLGFSRMEPFVDRLAGKLSGGMKQKLGLACALVHNPQILLLDEPTNGVDPVSRREFWRLLYDLNRAGTTIIISSSYMDEAERASHFLLLNRGSIMSQGIPTHVRNNFHDRVFELSTDRAREIKLQLGDFAPLKSITIFGESLHLAVPRDLCADSLSTFLQQRGIDSRNLREILPSFEDIYISLSQEN